MKVMSKQTFVSLLLWMARLLMFGCSDISKSTKIFLRRSHQHWRAKQWKWSKTVSLLCYDYVVQLWTCFDIFVIFLAHKYSKKSTSLDIWQAFFIFLELFLLWRLHKIDGLHFIALWQVENIRIIDAPIFTSQPLRYCIHPCYLCSDSIYLLGGLLGLYLCNIILSPGVTQNIIHLTLNIKKIIRYCCKRIREK